MAIDAEDGNTGGQGGPALLVLVLLCAQDRILLLQRGHEPYCGKWAPPGGFVEAHESLESAAVRETYEEVGIQINKDDLLPHAIISLPKLNQVYVVFMAELAEPHAPVAQLPEALDARWFSEAEFLATDLWAPAIDSGVGVEALFDRIRTRRCEIYQQTDDSLRVISTNNSIRYIWRNNSG